MTMTKFKWQNLNDKLTNDCLFIDKMLIKGMNISIILILLNLFVWYLNLGYLLWLHWIKIWICAQFNMNLFAYKLFVCLVLAPELLHDKR